MNDQRPYAVFEDGSRQYKVSEGDVVTVDWRDVPAGGRVEFTRVLLAKSGEDVKIGQPTLEGMRVLGDVVEHPSIKTYIQHYRKRKNYRRLKGHRQHYTAVKVQHILLAGQEAPPPLAAASAPTAAPAPAAPASATS